MINDNITAIRAATVQYQQEQGGVSDSAALAALAKAKDDITPCQFCNNPAMEGDYTGDPICEECDIETRTCKRCGNLDGNYFTGGITGICVACNASWTI